MSTEGKEEDVLKHYYEHPEDRLKIVIELLRSDRTDRTERVADILDTLLHGSHPDKYHAHKISMGSEKFLCPHCLSAFGVKNPMCTCLWPLAVCADCGATKHMGGAQEIYDGIGVRLPGVRR